jgi:hypothetical protein
MKKLSKILLYVFVVLLVIMVIPQLILTFPPALFDEKLIHNQFTVLSDKPIYPDMPSTLDSLVGRLELTGFYNHKPITIILCHSESKSAFLDKISMTPSGAGFHHFSGNVFLFPERIEVFKHENSKVTGEEQLLIQDSYQEFEFEDILSHEVLHKLHADTMGIWEFRREFSPPHWKAEGFAEYYTHRDDMEEDSEQYFMQQATLYFKYKDKFPLFYLRSRLLYEYLVDYKHLNFNDIMSDEVTEEDVYRDLSEMIERNQMN